MSSEIRTWLEKQLESSHPSKAGKAGALRLAQSAASLLKGGGMAFGLGFSGEDTAALGEEAVRVLRAWLAEGGEVRYWDLVEDLGSPAALEHAGIGAPEPDTRVGRARFTYPVRDADPSMIGMIGAHVPHAWEAIRDLPSFDGQDWIAGAELTLDAAGDTVVAVLAFDCRAMPSEDTLRTLAENLEMDLPESGVDDRWTAPSGETDVLLPVDFDEPPRVAKTD